MTAGIVIAIAIILIIAADIYLVLKGGFTNTISWWIWSHSVQYPIIPFAFGILMGHFFWDQVLNVNAITGCSK